MAEESDDSCSDVLPLEVFIISVIEEAASIVGLDQNTFEFDRANCKNSTCCIDSIADHNKEEIDRPAIYQGLIPDIVIDCVGVLESLGEADMDGHMGQRSSKQRIRRNTSSPPRDYLPVVDLQENIDDTTWSDESINLPSVPTEAPYAAFSGLGAIEVIEQHHHCDRSAPREHPSWADVSADELQGSVIGPMLPEVAAGDGLSVVPETEVHSDFPKFPAAMIGDLEDRAPATWSALIGRPADAENNRPMEEETLNTPEETAVPSPEEQSETFNSNFRAPYDSDGDSSGGDSHPRPRHREVSFSEDYTIPTRETPLDDEPEVSPRRSLSASLTNFFDPEKRSPVEVDAIRTCYNNGTKQPPAPPFCPPHLLLGGETRPEPVLIQANTDHHGVAEEETIKPRSMSDTEMRRRRDFKDADSKKDLPEAGRSLGQLYPGNKEDAVVHLCEMSASMQQMKRQRTEELESAFRRGVEEGQSALSVAEEVIHQQVARLQQTQVDRDEMLEYVKFREEEWNALSLRYNNEICHLRKLLNDCSTRLTSGCRDVHTKHHRRQATPGGLSHTNRDLEQAMVLTVERQTKINELKLTTLAQQHWIIQLEEHIKQQQEAAFLTGSDVTHQPASVNLQTRSSVADVLYSHRLVRSPGRSSIDPEVSAAQFFCRGGKLCETCTSARRRFSPLNISYIKERLNKHTTVDDMDIVTEKLTDM